MRRSSKTPVTSNNPPSKTFPVDTADQNAGRRCSGKRLDRLRCLTGCRRVSLLEFCLYFALACWATWPLPVHLADSLPQGTESSATVPLFNTWTVWWNADRAQHLYRGYWDAPIFHPQDAAFAFSEPQPTTSLVAPLDWAAGTPVPAYNAYLLLALALNGWSVFFLLRRLDYARLPAFFGGAMVEMLPFVHWQLGVLQLVPLCGVIWTIHALYNFGDEPGIVRGLAAGLAFAATTLLCQHYGLFLSVLLLLGGGWLLGRRLMEWRSWLRLLAGVLVAAVLLSPFLVKQFEVFARHDWNREVGRIRSLSAEPGDYTVPPWPQLMPVRDFATDDRRPHWKLSPGYCKLVLALFGAAVGLIRPGRRRWTAFCLTVLVASILLSLGPKLSFGEFSPYRDVLMSWYPGFAQVRNVFRFAVFAQLITAFLAVDALQVLRLERFRDSASRPVLLQWGAGSLVAAAGLTMTFEIRPAAQNLFSLPSWGENRAWLFWIRNNTEADSVLACLPFPDGRTANSYESTTLWMYWQTFHGRPLVNGYSGFFPEPFLEMKETMSEFPGEESLDALTQRNAAYCVVRRPDPPPDALVPDRPVSPRLQRCFGDDSAGIDIYRLLPEQSTE